MGYVFVSYSSENERAKTAFKNLLIENEIDGWFAPEDIPIGTKYAMAITKAVKNCSCVVVLLTKASVASQWVAKEIERAINYNKPIIPIMLEKVTLSEEFELYISTDQIVSISDFTKQSDNLARLIHAVSSNTRASDYGKQQLMEELGGTARNDESRVTAQSYKPILTLAAIVLAAVIAIVSIVSALGKKPTDNNSGGAQGETQVETQSENSGGTQNGNSENNSGNPIDYLPPNVAVNGGVNNGTENGTNTQTTPNQIPTRYEQDIQALQNADALSLSNKTVRVKVGELATPGASIAWTNVTVYSQNTNIAVGEGKMVKGVSPGETYVIVDTNGMMGSAYRVIVEE